MRIAFDLDGVLADMHAALQREARRVFAPTEAALAAERLEKAVTAPVREDGVTGAGASDLAPRVARDTASAEPGDLNLTSEQEARLWRHVRRITNFWDTLDEMDAGAVARLATLAQDGRWEVLFITNRPETAGDTAQRQSQRWLERHGFPLPSVFVVRGSRGKIAAALDIEVVVDDRPENCLDVVVDSPARAVLVWRRDDDVPAKARRLGIGRVRTVMECLDLLVEAERPSETPVRFVDRLRALLGLQPAPARRTTLWEEDE
jgi:hypothetical protein